MLKTAESVKRGHPDKICDQISDAILDECLKQDENSRVAIEVMGGHNIIYVCGELTTNAYVNISEIVKQVYRDIGYKNNIGVITNIVNQSPDISQGVDIGGAGDQGIMVGYACNENEVMIPDELFLARRITEMLELAQDDKILPDGKSQITLNDGKIETIIVSNQTTNETYLKRFVRDVILKDRSIKEKLGKDYKVHINPTGKFLIGGFDADTGLTGRKLAVDNYGVQVPIGGGCFSGKDYSKVDRSGSYMARKRAVELLKEFEAKEVLIKVAYSIGLDKPVMISVKIDENDYEFDDIKIELERFKPINIVKELDLKKPIYYKTSQHGHFGHGFNWDK